MFIKKDAKLVVDLIKTYLPEDLANNKDIIIAGGFALNAFIVNEMMQSLSDSLASSLISKNMFQNPLVPFSDVDLWITNDSSDSGIDILFSKELKDKISYNNSLLSISYKNILLSNRESISIDRASDWANTFMFSSSKRKVKLKPIQCIVRKQDSVESLLSSFDLGICSVAIYNGEFIIHPSFMDSMNKKQLTINNQGLMRKSLASKVFQALRHFKYYEKTGFEFSRELYQRTLEVMSDSNTYWQECKKLGAISQWGGVTAGVKVKITTSDNYEQEVVTKESTNSMIKRLATHFAEMQKMSHWDISHALFIGDSDLFPVKSIIEKKLVDSDKKSELDKAFDDIVF
jgi:hypothetical protein